jgi:carbamoyl-phosphate synthase/aspartate carbamoyltransferase/dihydroorotase
MRLTPPGGLSLTPDFGAERLSFFAFTPETPKEATELIRLPGLIDPHVHMREPGATHKEDFDSGTAAALAGGFTTVLAMPNTQPPITDHDSLVDAQRAAREKARCDYGIYVGAGVENAQSAADLAAEVCGLKMYLDQTFGPLHLKDLGAIQTHFSLWPSLRPLVAHAELRSLAVMLLMAALYDRAVHICHVSRKEEILLIRKAKERGIPVTCEVTPHHLFLTEADIPHLGAGNGEVRPKLASASDRDALWENMDVIDCFATDHAPHTLQEKEKDDPPPGFPGLETALGFLMGAVHEGRLKVDELIARMYTRPQRIFGIPEQPDTTVEVDQDARWEVRASELHSRCGWSPFEGMQLRGQVRRVKLRGRVAYQDGEICIPPGYGRNLSSADPDNKS